MKKLKVLLSAVLTCVLAFSLAGCSANCGGDDGTGGGEDVIVPTGITINTDSVKTQYNVDEDYSSEGLIVTLSEHNQTQNVDVDPRVLELTDENLTIDSSDFIKGTPGTYAINVSYTAQEVTVETSYEVTVKLGAGLVIEKGITTYALDSDGTTIDLSDLTVYLAGAFGQRGEPISNYTSELYLGDQKVEAINSQYVVTAPGAYHVWVELNDYTVPGISEVIDLSAFVIVYVTDDLQSIAFNSEAAGTLTTQETGADVMTPTWTFTATYASGLTKPLTAEEVEIEGVVTNAATEAGEATVTYSEVNAKGEVKTAAIKVNYTVTEKPVTPGQTNTYNLSISELAEAVKGTDTSQDLKLALSQEAFNTTSNSFLTISEIGSSDVYRSKYECIELKDGLLSVVFEGTGTLTIAVRSTGTTNHSDVGLKGPDGTWVSATYDTSNENIKATDGYYDVTGSDYISLTFEITTAGKYTIESNISGNNGRAVRINAISMVDTVAASTSEHKSTLSISELAEAVKGTDTSQDLKLALSQEAFNTTSNSFLTISEIGSSDVYRSKYECIELKDGLLSVVFEGTGTLTIAVRSTGTTNHSDVGLKGPDGTWVSATYDTSNENIKATDGYYDVTGSDYISLTFEITTAGKYTIESNISGNNGRAVRINAISMVDNY